MVNSQIIKEELAQAYKILAYLKLDDHTYTHLSSRSADGESFYIYPFGLRFEEVEASSLLRVSLKGQILEGKEYQYNKTGYVIHGTIYQAKKDINSIFHIHTPEIVAISACEKGLEPTSQWALHFYDQVSYHEYDSLVLDVTQGNRLITDLADNYTMLLRNHGSITCGRTIQEATFYSYHLQQACKTQCLINALNTKISTPSHEICKKTVNDLLNFEKNLGARDWQAWVRLIKKHNFD